MYIIILLVIIIVVIYMLYKRYNPPAKTLYERLGGIYSIAAVVDEFSNRLIKNSVVGINSKNPQLRDWHRNKLSRLPGLKFMRTLWVVDVSGGPFRFCASRYSSCPFFNPSHLNLAKHHCPFKINSEEFDAVASELAGTLDHFNVPAAEKNEVLSAFAAHKPEVTSCSISKL